MKKTIISVVALVLSFTAGAQTARQIIEENPYRAANNLHSYEFVEIKDTPAPKGYKPFYISHYGRHGSRFEQNSTFAAAALTGFEQAQKMGILSPKGQTLYLEVKRITDEHKGMEGTLTPRGAQEHRTLATRMAKRFPDVFKGKKKMMVRVLSSTSPRSLVSMANFTTSLKDNVPQVDYDITCADKYMYFIGPNFNYGALTMKAMAPQQGAAQAAPATYDFSRLYSEIFTDPAKAREIIRNMDSFVRAIYSAGSMCEDLDYLGIDIFRNYFTTDELVYLFQQQNDMIYLFWGNSLEGGDDVRSIIRPLVKDIVEKADQTLKEGGRVADLRFGHDTGVMPLFAILGMDDANGERYHFNQAHEKWFGGLRIPMGSNFQMIFYRNGKGDDIIVKVLHNETEARIKGVTPVTGPYYSWETLRKHLVSLYE